MYRYEYVCELGYLYSKSARAFCEKICTALVSRRIEKQHGVLLGWRIFSHVNMDAVVSDDADINYVSPEDWRPKSPDTAHMDYSFGCILTRELHKKSTRTLAGLKRILKFAWTDPIQDVFQRALHS